MADRAHWEQATHQQRQLAIAADAELRRRHPGQRHPPLRSSEPRPATQQQRDELALTAGEDILQPAPWIKDLAARRREFKDHLAERQSLLMPAQHPHREPFGPAFPALTPVYRYAILQPPKPQIQPPAQLLDRVADRDQDMEAAE